MTENVVSIRAADNSIVKLECHTRVESCAEIAREYAKNGGADRFAVISEYDFKAGGEVRGVYMSLLLRPSFFPSQAGLLSSLSTVALAKALEEHTTSRIGIGWVSNVYCEGKQIGGVTIEGKLDNFTTYEYIIINFSAKLSAEDFPPRLTDLIKKVFESDNNSIATIIAKNILNKFFPLYANMKSPAKFMQTYHQKFILSGIKTKLLEGGKKKYCKILSIRQDDCALIVEKRDKSIAEILTPASVLIPKTVRLSKK